MKKTGVAILGICAAILFSGCAKEVPGNKRIHEILEEETRLRVTLGEAYLQSEVEFDMENDRAVVPVEAEWGLPKYRDGKEVGVSYGEEGGAEIYDADRETNPELYVEEYLDLIQELDLTVEDVRASGFDVKVIKDQTLKKFEEELTLLSGMVVKDSYELVGVSIKFDDKYRPIKKEFQFAKKDNTSLDNVENDSEKCTQEFSYEIGKRKFDSAFEKVKKEIDRDM